MISSKKYVGRLAPTTSGLLHAGHASTFYKAFIRFKQHKKLYSSDECTLILRLEDIDHQRCQLLYENQIIADIKWLGIEYNCGYGVNTVNPKNQIPNTPLLHRILSSQGYNHVSSLPEDSILLRSLLSYRQSERLELYRIVRNILFHEGFIYPSYHSRKDISSNLPYGYTSDDPIFPNSLRPSYLQGSVLMRERNAYNLQSVESYNMQSSSSTEAIVSSALSSEVPLNWRFITRDNECVSYLDGNAGYQSFIAGKDYGDFLVWRKDDYPSYELAVVIDDALMGITEVVRGEDLLKSTARQLLLYAALGLQPPMFYHCPLILDPVTGKKFSKRDKSRSLKDLRDNQWIFNTETFTFLPKE